MNTVLWTLLSLTMVMGAPSSTSLRGLYHQGRSHYQKQSNEEAQRAFKTLLPKLEQTQKTKLSKNTRPWHLMTLGQCDVLFHLAQIAERQKKGSQACLYYRDLIQRFRTVPSAWMSWKPNPNLPGRMKLAQERFTQFCPTVASEVRLETVPTNVTISLQTGPQQWKRVATKRLFSIQKQVTLRVEAKGYITRIYRNVSIPRWKSKTLKLTLKKKPKPKPRPIAIAKKEPIPIKPATPTAKPVYKQWWFWTITGVVVVAGVTAAVAIPLTAKREESLQSGPDGGAFHIWKTSD